MIFNDPDEIIDAEVTSDETDGESLDVPVTGADQANALLSLEELIKNHIEAIDKLKIELKTQREMYEDSFNSNPTYREHNEKVKEVSKGKNSVRQEISKQPSVATLAQKVKDLRFDMNEQSKTLSDLLQDYHEQTGATSIETRDGKVLEIVSTSKLVRRSS
jgi:predicted RNase H-like nuclease (RuvC/YqgF family)